MPDKKEHCVQDYNGADSRRALEQSALLADLTLRKFPLRSLRAHPVLREAQDLGVTNSAFLHARALLRVGIWRQEASEDQAA